MKAKYIPIEDRRNIKLLKKTHDHHVVIDILQSILKRSFTLQVLWLYKPWFDMLTKEELDSYPDLKTAYIQLKIIEGNLDNAYELILELEEGTINRKLAEVIYPHPCHEFIDIVSSIDIEKYGIAPVMPMTTGRPSVLAGAWDFSEIANNLIRDKTYMDDVFYKLYGDKGRGVTETLIVEILYQRNECYDALVKIVGLIPFLKDRQDMRLLFVALTHQMFIMVLNNQVVSAAPMMEALRNQIVGVGLEEYIPNLDALEAWAAMYEGDFKKITKWMREEAPDEHTEFLMIDTFRYMIKLRVYLIQDKHLAITYLSSKLYPMLEKGHRYKDLCELYLIWAMSDYSRGDKESAFKRLKKTLDLASKYRFDRVIADEGLRAYELLVDYREKKGTDDYLDREIEITREIAFSHPNYLKKQLAESPSLTPAELNVLKLLAEGHSNAEIARLTQTSVDNIKFHLKKIYAKLEVSSRHQAVVKSVEIGLIEPIHI